jgi:hypothetical protein
MWGAEMGANEHGVVIGNEAVFTRRTGDRHTPGSLLGMDLLRLALERAASAEAAVEVIVTLLQAHGQGGSCSHEHPRFRYDNSFLVADRDGAIVLETAGRHWATGTVTGAGRSISNGLTIPDFARAHADPVRGRVAACAARRSRTQPAAEASRAPADLFRALRDHGGPAVSWSALNGGLRAPCVHGGGLVTGSQSTSSWVADLRSEDRHWVTGTSAPCLSLFKPVGVSGPPLPDPPEPPTNHFDAAYRWWRHERLHRQALTGHAAALALIAPERDRIEADWLAEPPDQDAAFTEADAAEARWLARLTEELDGDDRPGWLRRHRRALDRAAMMPA